MKLVLAFASALVLAGCASDPYYGGYGYSYDVYRPYSYGPTYYYDYGYPYYGSPSIGGGISFSFRDDDYRRGYRYRDHDGRRDRWRDRDNDGRPDRDWRRDRDWRSDAPAGPHSQPPMTRAAPGSEGR